MRRTTSFFLKSPFSRHYISSPKLESSKNTRNLLTMRVTKKQLEQRPTSPLYIPRTENQKQYVNYLQDQNTKLVIGIGPAGTGKTLFACNAAIEELQKGTIQKIILTRPVVPVEEEELGFLPGSLINKMDPWTRPLFDVLLDFYNQKDIDAMLHGGVLEISPLAYMRGRTFKRSFIIADEMQNSTPNQMKMLMTRIGDHSKMVITGDLHQSDRGMQNGLSDFLEKIKQENLEENHEEKYTNKIRYIELGNKDIQRSPIVSKILDIYNKKPLLLLEAPKEQPKEQSKEEPKEEKKIDVENDAAMLPKTQIPKKQGPKINYLHYNPQHGL
jgi:phosphate starvation-inducible PhoH-like protein